MSIEKDAPETKVVEDRGDDFTPETQTIEVELTGEDLAAIGRAPEKTDAAEPGKDEKTEEKPDAKAEEKKDIRIPKARFDEVRKKAQTRISALETALKAAEDRANAMEATPDVQALETELDEQSSKYGQLVADGKLDEADVVMRSINKLNRRLALVEATSVTTSQTTEAKHMSSLEDLVTMYKETFPVFDNDSPEYNQDYVTYVAKLQGGFEASGMSPGAALSEAVEVAVSRFGLTAADEPAKTEEKAKPDKGAERKTAAIDKALKAAGAQPAVLAKAGVDSDKLGVTKIDLENFTQDEFNRLSESTVKRLRGDIV